jgi:hypothetical protein
VAESTTVVSAVSAAASAISELTAATTKCTATEDGGTNDDDQIANNNPAWGWNCDNSTVAGRQVHVLKNQKLTNRTQYLVCIPYNLTCY